MICEHCKERHATVTVTQVQNQMKLERHYCEVCAAKFHPVQFDVQEEPVSIHQLMSDWFGLPMKKQQEEVQQAKRAKVCQNCNMTYRQFLKVGKFGCASCYEAFREQLPPVLKRLQADVQHVGKIQTDEHQLLRYQQQLEAYKLQLREAIDEERFEDAAKLRDEIRAIQHRLQLGGVDAP